MHLDTNQFLELVVEASGLDREKVEKQLAELIKEIRQAVTDQDAYEIEGFGIFSGIGNRIMFIPSKELETEINFKYVGMEPIELDDAASALIEEDEEETDPFAGLEMEEKVADSSTFEGLIDDLDQLNSEIDEKSGHDPVGDEEETPGPDAWGVEAHKEDESADRLFASLMGQEYEPPVNEEEGIEEKAEFDGFGDVFGEDQENEDTVISGDNLQEELSSLMGDQDEVENPQVVSEDILNAGLEDDDEDPFLELDAQEEPVEEEQEAVEEESDEQEVLAEDEIEEETEIEEEVDPEASILEQLEDDPDFDDPFEITEEAELSDSQEEIIPVITNLSSRPKTEQSETIQEKEEKPKKEKKKTPEKKPNQEPAPLWLWIVLMLVVTGSAVFALGYFNIVTIPYITPQQATNTAPVQNPASVQNTTPAVSQQPQPQTPPPMEVSTETEEPVTEEPEQEVVTEVPVQQEAPVQRFDGDVKYGLNGLPSEAGNDGYTIVIYSLSNQQNAINEHQSLMEDGYRALLTSFQSEQYGTLWRVSIGQFASLYDAAVAAEDILDVIPENYFIKKIN